MNVTFSGLVEGEYIFRLTATDNDGESSSDDVKVVVSGANAVPIVSAGSDKNITLPTNTVVISGSASDADGTITSYIWTKISGPTATLSNENTPTLTLSNLTQGTYIFRLTATDNDGGTGNDEVQVIVNAAVTNQPPVAQAGNDLQITLPVNSTNITGTGSDTDGSILSYQWTKISGGAAVLSNASNPTLSVSGLIEGVYVFQLTVTDDDNATGSDRMTLTVVPGTVNQLIKRLFFRIILLQFPVRALITMVVY